MSLRALKKGLAKGTLNTARLRRALGCGLFAFRIETIVTKTKKKRKRKK